jgi:hypothetical protein
LLGLRRRSVNLVRGNICLELETLRRAEQARGAWKAPMTQAGEFVHEEIEHVRSGKHGAGSMKQVIAIGLSKARRAGINVPPPRRRR